MSGGQAMSTLTRVVRDRPTFGVIRGHLDSRPIRPATLRLAIASAGFWLVLGAAACRQFPETALSNDLERQGQRIFRDDTFGNEVFWTDTARLHEIVQEEIQPLEALSLGLKVDMDRLNLLSFLF